MIPIALHLNEKNVLIVGGGQVALQRAKKYCQDGAKVTVVSFHFLNELKNSDVICIQDGYHHKYLDGQFMVYAATDSRAVNHQIMLDCKERNILCGSATKDDDASFYGMSYRENEVGMVAYSSHQRLPYVAPLLDMFMKMVDDNKEKLELLAYLRPYIIKFENYNKSIFQILFEESNERLNFLKKSLEKGYGIIFVYHKNRFDNHYDFHLQPSLFLSIEEFHQLQMIFQFPVQYYIVPLALFDGIIYQQMVKSLLKNMKNLGPMIKTEEDIDVIRQLLSTKRKQIWILHNRKNEALKRMFKERIIDVDIYDFHDHIQLDKEEKYSLTVLLLGHGKHYRDYQNLVNDYIQKGYDIVFDGNLLDHQEYCLYYEKKIENFIENV